MTYLRRRSEPNGVNTILALLGAAALGTVFYFADDPRPKKIPRGYFPDQPAAPSREQRHEEQTIHPPTSRSPNESLDNLLPYEPR